MKSVSRLEIITAGLVAIVVLGTLYFSYAAIRASAPPPGVACTAEAKICPDGTAVGREGPNCEFTACPLATSTSAIATSTNTEDNVSEQ